MTAEQQIEKRLKALSAHTPSPSLDVKRLNSGVEKHQKIIRLTKMISSAAAVIVLIVGAVVIATAVARRQIASTVTIDTGAGFTVGLNRSGEVVDISGADQRGKHALAGFERSCDDADIAAAELITHLIDNGSLNERNNTVLITADCDDEDAEEALREQFADAVGDAYTDNGFDGALLSQTDDDSREAKHLSGRYHISRGKAQLLRELITADSTMSYRSLSRLNINDLNLIADSIDLDYTAIFESGESSGVGYLGEDEALKIVKEHLGADDASAVRIRLDARDGELLYRLTVRSGDSLYTYNLVAASGEIITVLQSKGSNTQVLIDNKSATATEDDNASPYIPPVNTPAAASGTTAPAATEAPSPDISTEAPVPTEQPATAAPTEAPGASPDMIPDAVSFTANNCYRVDADLMTAGFVTTTLPDDAEKVGFTAVFSGHAYGANPQNLRTFDSGTAAVICNKTQLDRFLSDHSDSFTDAEGSRFRTDAYTDAYFENHALIIAYYALYNLDYEFSVSDMYLSGGDLYVNASMSMADDLPTTAYSAHDLIVYEIDRSALTSDTKLILY